MVRIFNVCSGGRSAKDQKPMQVVVANLHDDADTLAGRAVRELGPGFHNTGYCAPCPDHGTTMPHGDKDRGTNHMLPTVCSARYIARQWLGMFKKSDAFHGGDRRSLRSILSVGGFWSREALSELCVRRFGRLDA